MLEYLQFCTEMIAEDQINDAEGNRSQNNFGHRLTELFFMVILYNILNKMFENIII